MRFMRTTGRCLLFFFKQKTAYEMRISDWSSDVCSSDLVVLRRQRIGAEQRHFVGKPRRDVENPDQLRGLRLAMLDKAVEVGRQREPIGRLPVAQDAALGAVALSVRIVARVPFLPAAALHAARRYARSEAPTSDLQSLNRP